MWKSFFYVKYVKKKNSTLILTLSMTLCLV